jgi:hypothetical protein
VFRCIVLVLTMKMNRNGGSSPEPGFKGSNHGKAVALPMDGSSSASVDFENTCYTDYNNTAAVNMTQQGQNIYTFGFPSTNERIVWDPTIYTSSNSASAATSLSMACGVLLALALAALY